MVTTVLSLPKLTVRSVQTRAVRVPLTFALGTSAALVRSVPLLLVDLQTDQGATGRCYLFCYTPSGARAVAGHLTEAVELLHSLPANPQGVATLLSRRYALLGVTGPVRMALSALDVAIWDALATAARLPLASLLGAERRAIPAYDSRGLGLMEPSALADEAEALLDGGLQAVKLRLGYPTLSDDLSALRSVRARVPADVHIMVDYNQALTRAEAISRGLVLQQERILWLEEPIRHDDYEGNAILARTLHVPVQIGENFNGPEAMLEAVLRQACDYVMPDLARIGGVTGWMQAAGIAAARGLEMSSHLMPEISVHLLAASQTAHWLEYVDWADAILEEPLRPVAGAVTPPDRPGIGLTWSEDKLRRLETV
jgi:mandelate racemase